MPGRRLSMLKLASAAVLGASLGAAWLLATAAPATAGPGLVAGAVEDDLRASTVLEAESRMTLFRLAGFRAVRVTSYWTPGLTAPSENEAQVLQNVARAADLHGVRLYVTIMNPGSRTTPLTEEAQEQYASYARALVKAVPEVRHVIVGNEPNLNRFWLPQFALDGSSTSPAAYLSLLARTYDALKAASDEVQVYGGAVSPRGTDNPSGSRPTHSPTTFIPALGAAYQASGRTKPVMDAFVQHVYGDHSSQAPTVAHPNGTAIGVADYDKLVALLGEAFDGTAQPGSMLPIVYGEYGVESQIPSSKAALYTGTEPETTKPTTEANQAAFYGQALAMSFCQPTVEAILVFHAQDERERAGWQSGVRYVDGTPKASLSRVREALDRTTGGSITRCPGVQLIVRAAGVRFGSRAAAKRGAFGASFTCDLDCVYDLRVVKVGGTTKMVKRGRADVGEPVVVDFLPRRLGAGAYRYRLKLVHPVNPGPPTVRNGPVFRMP